MNNIDCIHSQSRSNAISPCEHCLETVEHEPWCVMRDPKVQYAYAIVNEPLRPDLPGFPDPAFALGYLAQLSTVGFGQLGAPAWRGI